ncbi:hypothetical protein A1O3_08425 [Capronia epimyces CBS 606.96]|uniref:Shikimate dehydrogenase substrate binding N-terminal domain-containing protein n=1 Tax=Capronia epimyces CBS 606.96 TaxID=1182542 RepID=W9XNN6_9EURO|nr:uncharacterized protein A1O3_08425 [Capronia epimyces CBS 606.96]EXJ78925.1 hypothetical protein A1O3_08425 [Capronia epimyces CBS 606.96]
MAAVPSLSSTLEHSYEYGASLHKTIPQGQHCKTYLLGSPIAHSLAPLLHNTLFESAGLPWTYNLLESTNQQDLISLLPAHDTVGSAVTMPHKVTFISKVDEVTPEGRAIGAINTVFVRLTPTGGRRYIGTNTDCIGVREAFLRNLSPDSLVVGKSKPALVIGGGGACRSALYSLHHWLGVDTIYLVNRFKHEVDDIATAFSRVPGWKAKLVHVQTVEQAEGLEAPYFVVGTVPDYPPSTAEEKLALEVSRTLLSKPIPPSQSQSQPQKGAVLEMCYFPRVRTSFYSFVESEGWQVLPGTEAMIWQGVAQQVLWTESLAPADEEVVRTASQVVLQAIQSQQSKP